MMINNQINMAKFPPLSLSIMASLIGSMTLSPLHLYLVCGERTGAVVLWQAVASSKWMLHTGGGGKTHPT